jgi:hypothetical protein
MPAMCNRIRGLKEWSEIPRSLARSLINLEYNPNVAPTEQVPAFLAERGKPLATRMAVRDQPCEQRRQETPTLAQRVRPLKRRRCSQSP